MRTDLGAVVLGPGDYRIVALRQSGVSFAEISRRTGMRSDQARQRARLVVLTVAWSIDPALFPVWADLRVARVPDQVTAHRSRVGRATLRLVLDAWPALPAPGTTRVDVTAAVEQWDRGRTIQQIAAVATVSVPTLLRHLDAAAVALQPRWLRADISRYLGWGYSTAYATGMRQDLPAPDGVDGHERSWWWPATIYKWEQTLDICPTCGARPRSLQQHLAQHRDGETKPSRRGGTGTVARRVRPSRRR